MLMFPYELPDVTRDTGQSISRFYRISQQILDDNLSKILSSEKLRTNNSKFILPCKFLRQDCPELERKIPDTVPASNIFYTVTMHVENSVVFRMIIAREKVVGRNMTFREMLIRLP